MNKNLMDEESVNNVPPQNICDRARTTIFAIASSTIPYDRHLYDGIICPKLGNVKFLHDARERRRQENARATTPDHPSVSGPPLARLYPR